mmetsp:Transcript_15063/g.26618  ORF Transcript_15063/g.26618 Transcript_15063/m.26618 type:complete len:252 (-) Transcript_15063:94-849(-)
MMHHSTSLPELSARSDGDTAANAAAALIQILDQLASPKKVGSACGSPLGLDSDQSSGSSAEVLMPSRGKLKSRAPPPAAPAGTRLPREASEPYLPLAKRCAQSEELFKRFGWADQRPADLKEVLRGMRRPAEKQNGVHAGPWRASVARMRGAEVRRRTQVDNRPVPSWNFRYNGKLSGCSHSIGAAALGKDCQPDARPRAGQELDSQGHDNEVRTRRRRSRKEAPFVRRRQDLGQECRDVELGIHSPEELH